MILFQCFYNAQQFNNLGSKFIQGIFFTSSVSTLALISNGVKKAVVFALEALEGVERYTDGFGEEHVSFLIQMALGWHCLLLLVTSRFFGAVSWRMSTIETARQPSSRHLWSICSEMKQVF